MSSEETVHVSLMEVTPTSGKGTLGTWWFLRQARGLGLIKPSISTAARARDEARSKLFEDGAYVHQRLNLGTKGKAHGRNAKASNRT
jgi:hypothetical protein